MPFKSKKQRSYLWANHPKIAKKWTKEHGSTVKAKDGKPTKSNPMAKEVRTPKYKPRVVGSKKIYSRKGPYSKKKGHLG
jgi:hypothetical protein